MTTFRVHLQNTIGTSVEVEAETAEDALEAWWNSGDAPGSVMFLNHTYPDMGEWDVYAIDDEDGNEVMGPEANRVRPVTDWRSEFEEQQEREYWEWFERQYIKEQREMTELQSRCRG